MGHTTINAAIRTSFPCPCESFSWEERVLEPWRRCVSAVIRLSLQGGQAGGEAGAPWMQFLGAGKGKQRWRWTMQGLHCQLVSAGFPPSQHPSTLLMSSWLGAETLQCSLVISAGPSASLCPHSRPQLLYCRLPLGWLWPA